MAKGCESKDGPMPASNSGGSRRTATLNGMSGCSETASGGIHAVPRGWIEHDRNLPAATARATKALRYSCQGKVSAARTDKRLHVEFSPIAAPPLALQSFAPIVEAAYVDFPAVVPSLT